MRRLLFRMGICQSSPGFTRYATLEETYTRNRSCNDFDKCWAEVLKNTKTSIIAETVGRLKHADKWKLSKRRILLNLELCDILERYLYTRLVV